MNKICPYVNEHQYKTETKSKDIRLRFKAIIALAEAGNAEAMYLYGYALLTGIWDLEGMKNDMAHGKLLPPTEDAKDDPYLVIPRDIAKAVEYLRLIADMPGYDGEFWKKQSQGILTYCQKNGLAGFFVGDIKVSYPNPAELDYEDERMLDDNAKSAVDCDSEDLEVCRRFVPLPDARSKMTDPKVAMFKNIAKNARDRCIFQAIGSILFVLTISVLVNSRYSAIGWGNFGISLIYAVAILTIPLSLFAKLFDVYGVKQKLPICSCGRIHEAYEAGMKEISGNHSNFEDPFEATPFLVKNLLTIKHLYFWLCTVLPIAIFICSFKYPEYCRFLNYMGSALHVGIFVFGYSFLTTLFDKKAPKWAEELGNVSMLITAVLFLFSFALDDTECSEEVEEFEAKKEIQKIVDGNDY